MPLRGTYDYIRAATLIFFCLVVNVRTSDSARKIIVSSRIRLFIPIALALGMPPSDIASLT